MDRRTTFGRIAMLACAMLGVVQPAGARTSTLLGSDHGGHYWFGYCQDQPDDTPLPPDPRSLVTPTYDKAVAFNVAWHACLARQPATCGELRALAAAGGRLLRGIGDVAAGWQFSGDIRRACLRSPRTNTMRCGCAGGCSGAPRIST